MKEKVKPNAYDKFSLFPTLVSEIRLKIWKAALEAYGPRCVVLELNQRIGGHHYRVGSPTQYPPLLEVNIEARAEAQKFYDLVVENKTPWLVDEGNQCIYINPSSNHVYLKIWSTGR